MTDPGQIRHSALAPIAEGHRWRATPSGGATLRDGQGHILRRLTAREIELGRLRLTDGRMESR